MKSSSLGSMRQVTPRVLHGQVLGNALIMRSVGAWNVYIRLRRRCISSRSARWGFVMIPSVFSICDRQRRWSGFTPQRLAHKESYSTGPQLKKKTDSQRASTLTRAWERARFRQCFSARLHPRTSVTKVHRLLGFRSRWAGLSEWVFFRSHGGGLLLAAGNPPGGVGRLLCTKRLQIANRTGIWFNTNHNFTCQPYCDL